MNYLSFITLFGGLAFFLYGMNVMSNGLSKMAGGKLEKALRKMTESKVKSLLLGAGITIAIQSSSAMTVMLVGFVNSGIMELGQTIGVIMGSNIGTTLTAWILSATGIKSDAIWLQLLKPEVFSPIIALVGIIMIMVCKKNKQKDIGHIMVGFSILMYGMTLMSSAVSPLAESKQFASLLVAFKNPIIGVLVGTVFTGIIQSSAASVGILQALSLTGSISYGMALPIIMGQNIGTCVTALLSSIGVNRNAKRVAVIHITFNMIGTLVCLSVFYGLNAIFDFQFIHNAISPVGIAAVHSIFNIVTTVILLPFTKYLEKIACKIIKTTDDTREKPFIDERLLATPSVAISECKEHINKMTAVVKNMLSYAMGILFEYDEEEMKRIEEQENLVDWYEENLGNCMVKVVNRELSDSDSRDVSTILQGIGDLERMGDHAYHIAKVARDLDENELVFSKSAKEDLVKMGNSIREIVNITMVAFCCQDKKIAQLVAPMENKIDEEKVKLQERHIERLKRGECTIELGFMFNELVTSYERMSDHCQNITDYMLR